MIKRVLPMLLILTMLLVMFSAGHPMSRSVSAAADPSLIFRSENQTINTGYYTNLNEHLNALKVLEEGTIVVKFKYTGSTIMSLFSLSNNIESDGHFHLYITPTAIGSENRYSKSGEPKVNTHVKTGTIKLTENEVHTVAMVMDKAQGYKFFLDGELVKSDTTSARKFMNNIYAPNSARLGITERASGSFQYPLTGDIHYAEVYSTPLSDQTLIEMTKKAKPVVTKTVNRSFNGTNEYVDISSELSKVKSLQKGTLFAKFKMKDGGNAKALLSLSDSTVDASNLAIAINSGRINVSARVSSEYTSSGSFIMNYTSPAGVLYNDGQWHQLAVTIDSSSTVIYMDGQKIGTSNGFPFASAIPSLNTFLIGANRDFKASPEWYYKGDIENVTVYDGRLDDWEMKALTAPIDVTSRDLNQIKAYINTTSQPATFLFTGDDITFSAGQAGGYRNFMQHFEERIRWELASSAIQRNNFVFNTGMKGLTSAELIADFNRLVTKLQPKTVFVMLGKGDAEANVPVADFKANLKTIVTNIRDMGAVPVLQTEIYPTDVAYRTKLAPYVETVKAVASEDHVVLSNHYDTWKTYTNLSSLVDAEGKLPNQLGHLALAKELMTLFSVGGSGNTWSLNGFSDVKEQVTPTVDQDILYSLTGGVLNINLVRTLACIPDVEEAVITLKSGTETYTKQTMNLTDSFSMGNLVEGQPYVLTVKARAEGERMYADLNPAYLQGPAPESAPIPAELTSLIQSDQPITWLFSGDSITHGALHLKGYKSFAELFGERVRGELSTQYPARAKDLVLNTGVSSATTRDLVANFDRWITVNDPDVVFLAFGMNDSSNRLVPIAEYEANLRNAVDKIRLMGAVPILGTINTIKPGDAGRLTNLPAYVQVVRDIAEDKNVLLVDHYKYWTEAEEVESNIKNNWLNDNIHPNYIGSTHMAANIFQAVGIYDPSSYISSLRYKVQGTVGTLNVSPAITKGTNEMTINIQSIVTAAGGADSVESITATFIRGQEDVITAETRKLNAALVVNGLSGTDGYTVQVIVKVKGQNRVLYLNPIKP